MSRRGTSGEAPDLVAGAEAMSRLAGRLDGIERIAIDTEFVRERTFTPRLELLQVGLPDGTIEIVDWMALGADGAEPLVRVLHDPGVLKVFHAADQDLEILAGQTGRVPGPIWDTQLVAGLFGYSGRTGYTAVVEALLGSRPKGREALTDWSRRPLSGDQLRYAAEDVRYLLPLLDEEKSRLERLGRVPWAEQECSTLRERAGADLVKRTDERAPHQRVKGWQKLRPRQLAVLRELAVWRQLVAQKRNRPLGTVVRDDLLVEIARRAPTVPAHLETLRGFPGRFLHRYGEEVIAAVATGAALPKSKYPEAADRREDPDETEKALVALLQASLRTLALEREVTVGLLGSSADVGRLVSSNLQGEALEGHRLLEGWRGEVVGEDLVAVLRGERSISWNPETRTLRLLALD